MTKLSVNVNKVALLRNSRDLDIPNVVQAAKTCIAASPAVSRFDAAKSICSVSTRTLYKITAL